MVAERHVTDLTLDARRPILKADNVNCESRSLKYDPKLKRFDVIDHLLGAQDTGWIHLDGHCVAKVKLAKDL